MPSLYYVVISINDSRSSIRLKITPNRLSNFIITIDNRFIVNGKHQTIENKKFNEVIILTTTFLWFSTTYVYIYSKLSTILDLILELCAYNIQSCIIAENSGASRIELCGNPLEGGTTPSYGLIKYTVEQLSIPVFPMIRPRGGNFMYSESEFAIMRTDIATCKELGCKGIATGAHLSDKTLDVEMMSRLVEWAYPMQVTCHKVFDRVPDAQAALDQLMQIGCTRVLTSGLEKTAIDGASLLKEMGEWANRKIIIMPGGGVRSDNIRELAANTHALEFHSSGIISITQNQIADGLEVSGMVRMLNSLTK